MQCRFVGTSRTVAAPLHLVERKKDVFVPPVASIAKSCPNAPLNQRNPRSGGETTKEQGRPTGGRDENTEDVVGVLGFVDRACMLLSHNVLDAAK